MDGLYLYLEVQIHAEQVWPGVSVGAGASRYRGQVSHPGGVPGRPVGINTCVRTHILTTCW